MTPTNEPQAEGVEEVINQYFERFLEKDCGGEPGHSYDFKHGFLAALEMIARQPCKRPDEDYCEACEAGLFLSEMEDKQ